ncbi:MAG: hypothetical protein HXX13_07115 [Bacteroidetes bacterium]|nr:hypothetical protein [Bacteroidota bacterium]
MNRSFLPFLFPVLVFSVFLSCASGNREGTRTQNNFKPGEVQKKVLYEADSLSSYALYIPLNYNPDKSCPLLICFDPHAEGLLPVNLFREQCDKYGFIVAGSNNSKNGMTMEETTEIYRKIRSDLESRFKIDVTSVYLAGFSGGSRVAGAAAITEGNVAGVIGCGAGLPNVNKQPVKAFSYLGVAGLQDFNYNDLKQVDESLEKAGYTHHLLLFDGKHEWPLKEVVPDIFTWLNFDRMRTKSIPTDRAAINTFIDVNYTRSEEAGKKGDFLNQLSILEMLRDYLSGLTDVSPLETEISKLNLDPKVKQQKDKLAILFDRERTLQSDYASKLQSESPKWWEKTAENLSSLSDKQPVTDESRMYKRLLGFLSLNTYMLCNSALKQSDLNTASRFIELYRLVDPTNAEHRYMAATVSMKQGKKDEALKELGDAFQLGFKDIQRLTNDPVFTALHQDKTFMKLLNK